MMKRVAGSLFICIAATLVWVGADKAMAQDCSATIENGKKYHWYVYSGGTVAKTGWVMFTDTAWEGTKWFKVKMKIDGEKNPVTWWGHHSGGNFTIKGGSPKERWEGYSKYCTGAKILGTIYKDPGYGAKGKFVLDTGKIRD